jgi:hypothetical protein
MTDFEDSAPIDAVLSVDVDPSGQNVLLTLDFERNTAVRLPMSAEVAMRLWRILDKARLDHDWPVPTTPIAVEQLQ